MMLQGSPGDELDGKGNEEGARAEGDGKQPLLPILGVHLEEGAHRRHHDDHLGRRHTRDTSPTACLMCIVLPHTIEERLLTCSLRYIINMAASPLLRSCARMQAQTHRAKPLLQAVKALY